MTKKQYKIGDVLPDGWIVGPISPDTGIPIAMEPLSVALCGERRWIEGESHAESLRTQGHEMARQASTRELGVIYEAVVEAGRNKKAKLPTEKGSSVWSSRTSPALRKVNALSMTFAEGEISSAGCIVQLHRDTDRAHVRCIRDERGIKLS